MNKLWILLVLAGLTFLSSGCAQSPTAPLTPDQQRGQLLGEAGAAMLAKNYGTAKKDYLEAAQAGDPVAMNGMGWLYENGLGVEKDGAKAMSWYQKAADAGYARAMDNVGWLYQHGDSIWAGL